MVCSCREIDNKKFDIYVVICYFLIFMCILRIMLCSVKGGCYLNESKLGITTKTTWARIIVANVRETLRKLLT